MANPALVVPIPDRTVTKGQSVSFAVTTNLVDPDAGDRIVYSFTGLPTGTGLSGDSSTGILSASSLTAADLAAVPFNVTVTGRAASNDEIVGSFTLPFDGTVEEPSVSANYYVSSTATGTGSGTLASPYTVSQIAALNVANLGAVTHVYVDWEPGNYDDKPYIPYTGGVSSSVMLKHRVRTAGVVRFRGSQSGSARDYAIELRVGVYSGTSYAANYIEFERASDRNFEIDGQVVFGTSGGQVGKGQNPENYAKIRKGLLIEGVGCVIDLDIVRTAGWSGTDISNAAANNIYRISHSQHGTPFYPGPDGTDDFGDMTWLDAGNGSTRRHLFDGRTSTSCHWTRGGHSGPQFFGGTGAFRNQTLNGNWAALPTFTSGDGQRAMTYTSRVATGWHAYNIVINRGGQPSDTTYCELMKLEGTNNTISDSILRNADHDAFNIASFTRGLHARGGRVSHCVIEGLPGQIADMRDYLDDGTPGVTRINDYQFKNCIIRNLASNPRSGRTDEIIHLELSTGVNWTNVIQMHGITIEDATRNASQLYITINRGTSPPGSMTITYALANYPANFSNITVTTNAGLSSAPSAATDIDATEIATYYTLAGGDTTSKAQGVALTLANGAGVSSTALVVDDARWFDDPQDGVPPWGQQSDGFYVHVNGANRLYTAINYTTNTLTLAAAASWSDNAPVNKKITSGSTPNRGCIR